MWPSSATSTRPPFWRPPTAPITTFPSATRVSINGVTYENVMMLDDLPCVFVPQSRMKTVITVQSGDSDQGGIVAGENAKDIACLITHCETPLAVSKLDAIKQFGPQENQLFDGTSIQARYLYDLFVPGKRLASIGAVVAP